MSEAGDGRETLEEILISLGLQDLIPKFEDNKITLESVLLLEESDFAFLGVTTVGDRVRLKERCRAAITPIDEGRLEQLLIFATRLSEIPVLGIDPTPQLHFKHPEQSAMDEFPVTNTCTLTIRIPILPDYNVFQERMMAAIEACTTFARA